jgi:hypothetical protein
MMSMKKRVFIATCSCLTFVPCGVIVFLMGLYFHLPGIVRLMGLTFHPPGLVRLIGIMIILGGLLGATTLVVTYLQAKAR